MKLGLKIHFTDPPFLPDFTPQMYELHLADHDLARHWDKIIDAASTLPSVPLVIHSPQNLVMRSGKGPLVNIASEEEGIRKRGLQTIMRTLELAGEIDADYVVVHPGGVTPEPLPNASRLMENLLSSLHIIEQDFNTREILMENMPWFYWMWGDTECWHSNLLLTPEDYAPILDLTNICLDICHAYLSVKEGSNQRIIDFLKIYSTRIKHLHLSDAAVPDQEGLQFGDGEIDMPRIMRIIIDRDVTAIPEIKGGHRDDMKGFREAIDRLQEYM